MPKLIPQQLGKILYHITEGKAGSVLEAAIKEFHTMLREKSMTSKLPYILAAFTKYAKQQEGIVELRMAVARPLTKKMQERIQEHFGKNVESTVEVDPSILGGVVVRAGDKIFDASIRTQLSRMKQKI